MTSSCFQNLQEETMNSFPLALGAIILFGMGDSKYTGGHKIFDDQNVGSHKMTTDSVFILFNFTITILVCFGERCIGDWRS